VFRIIVTEETELDPEVARLMDADADAAAAEPVVQMAVEDPAAQGGSWWQWMFGGQHIGGAQQAE